MSKFCEQARNQVDVLTAMASKMDELYTALAEYFVFDKQKYTLEEFMGDVKAFRDQFKVRSSYKTAFKSQQLFTISFFYFCRNPTRILSRNAKLLKSKHVRARLARRTTRRGR